MTAEDRLIELDGVEWQVEKPVPTRILHPIDLTVGRATSLAVVGPSGAGKSSLAAILGVLQPPSAGSYRFQGHEVGNLDARAGARFRDRHVGFVFQNSILIDERSAWRNVAIALTDPTLERREVEERSHRALEDVGLGPIADREAALLSGGERQRVAIARAMVCDPLLILADEPTGALDQVTGRKVLELLYSLTDTGTTLVVVTHDTTAASMAEDGVEIVDGRLVG